jgi:hypothetical protein
LASRVGIGRPGGLRVFVIHLLLVGVFGVYLPWTKGIEFLDPVITAAYACLGVLFAAPAAAQSFAEDRPHSWVFFTPDLGTLAAAAAMGLTGSVAMASIAGWLALRFSPFAARTALRVIFLLLLGVFLLRSRWLPDVAIKGAAISLGIAAVAFYGVQRLLEPGE